MDLMDYPNQRVNSLHSLGMDQYESNKAPGDFESVKSTLLQSDYAIPAIKTGRPTNLAVMALAKDSLLSEASAHLQDADFAPKMSGRFNVFGNAAYEADAREAAAAAAAIITDASGTDTPTAVRMNNLFNDPANANAPRSRQLQVAVEESASSGLRASSQSRMRKKDRSAGQQEEVGTIVQAFNSEEEAQNQALPAPRSGPSTLLASAPKSIAAWEMEIKQMISGRMQAEALHLAAPSTGMVRCCVKRVKAFFGGTSFQMHLENGDVFLMAARKRKKSKVSAYVLSQDLEDLKRDTDNCLAKLKANFVGTEYMLWGKSDDSSVRKGYAAEQLCINYKQTALSSSGGPRAMYVVLPMPDANWQPTAVDGADSLSNSLEMAKQKELPPYLEKKMAMLCTKPPEYDESIKGYTLDFQGRVKEASVKNFQLVAWDHNTDRKGNDLMIQFGKVDGDTYALDFTYPFTVQAAFAVALASIDTKLCYTL